MTIKGEILKKLIKDNGYTQEQFASCVGISLSNLKAYMNETKKSSPSVDTLFKISKKLDVDYGYLIGSHPFRLRENNDLYGVLKNLPGFSVSCNPINEDQIFIKYKNLEMYTTANILHDKFRKFMLFQMFLENEKEQ